MDIRLLKQQELIPALQLTWDVFVADVVPSYSTEGVEEFQKFIRFENIAQMHRNKELIFFGAFEKNEILGVIAGKKDGHITLFFVKKDMQGHGIGKMLLSEVFSGLDDSELIRLHVESNNSKALDFYKRIGFQPIEETNNRILMQKVNQKEKSINL